MCVVILFNSDAVEIESGFIFQAKDKVFVVTIVAKLPGGNY